MKIVGGKTIEDVKVGSAGVVFEPGDNPEELEEVLGALGFFEGCDARVVEQADTEDLKSS